MTDQMPDGTKLIVLENAIRVLSHFADVEPEDVIYELTGTVFSEEEAGILREWLRS